MKWTKTEEAIIIANSDKSIDAIMAMLPNRTRFAVISQIIKMKKRGAIDRRSNRQTRKWSVVETNWLMDNLNKPLDYMATLLDRDKISISNKMTLIRRRLKADNKK